MIHPRYSIGRLGNLMFKQAYIYAQFRDGLVDDPYVQDEKYFVQYKEDVKKMFGEGIGLLPFVAIHVRRGDYVGSDFHVDLFAEGYYEKAMAQFPDANFLIFSDDIAWCKEQKIFDRHSFSEGNDEIADFNAMASCIGHIIANSSFSWWAAWISPHLGKVVAPSRWFYDNVQRVGLPAHWITI